jgi:hypothetical protein
MIEFTHATTRYTVKPENAQAIRKALAKPKKHKPVALSSVNLKRAYPAFEPGMSTANYVSLFNTQFDGMQHKIKHGCPNYHNSAPMLDPSIPECVEDDNPDYVPEFLTVKVKPVRVTAATLKASIVQALECLERGDSDTAQCILNEALK